MNSFLKILPNCLTYLRILLIPILVVLLSCSSEQAQFWSAWVFGFAALTDLFDGYIARKTGNVSDIGKLLDPMADKILVMAVLVMLVARVFPETGNSWVPAWLVVLILAREIWVTGLRAVAANKGVVVAADKSGKWKTTLQMVAIFLLLFPVSPLPGALSDGGLHCLGLGMLFISVLLSYWGAVGYSRQVLRG